MLSGEVHCQYCQCPKEIWKPSMKTYKGDECKLYDDFTNAVYELEKAVKPFNNLDIINKCRTDFEADYSDIADFEATVNEMIEINIDLGVMPGNYGEGC
jgi:hypothetical protein